MVFDPILLELYRHRFASIAEEMGEALRRTGFSPNIKERLDFSCALFDAKGRLVAQAAHIPVHLGAMPASVEAARAAVGKWREGDVVILNDPFAGGTHLPDVTLVTPIFCDRENPEFFVANRAHHADIGGMSPGSLPLSSEIYQEGIIIPPLKLVEAGGMNQALLELIVRNTRTPLERRGDLEAQLAASFRGKSRIEELVGAYGLAEVAEYAGYLQEYAENCTRKAIKNWPNGVFRAQDELELTEGTAQIQVAITIEDEDVHFDFEGTSPVVPLSLNAVEAIARSACFYVVACLLGDDVPLNAGTFAPLHIYAPQGSIVNAQNPAAVAGGNVETSQRIVDVVLQAVAQALPEAAPACSAGTMNNLTIGGMGWQNVPFTYYETLGGGAGASALSDGESATQTHMTNTLNTPVEALERAFPLRIGHYGIRRESGGKGLRCGGEGLVREYEFLHPATVTMLSQRRRQGAPGRDGGHRGAVGRNIAILSGRECVLEGNFTRHFEAGQMLRVETPGGGGFSAQANASAEVSRGVDRR